MQPTRSKPAQPVKLHAIPPAFISEGMKAREALQIIENALVEAGLERLDAATERGAWGWLTTEYARRNGVG
jgi:hypothetical protein